MSAAHDLHRALCPERAAPPRTHIVEQVFRGETSFVVKDPATQKYFRFRPVEMGVMRCFDGARTPDEIAAALAEQGVRLTARAVEGFARKLAVDRAARAHAGRADDARARANPRGAAAGAGGRRSSAASCCACGGR